MLTLAQVGAILAILTAFGVDPSVVANVSTILIPPPIEAPVNQVQTPEVQTQVPASSDPVDNQPLPVLTGVQSLPVTPLIFKQFVVQDGVLKIISNHELDLSKTAFTGSVSLGSISMNGSPWIENTTTGLAKFGVPGAYTYQKAYQYEAALTGTGDTSITVQDSAGNTSTRSFTL